jgi:histidyl-tRNA synthetase
VKPSIPKGTRDFSPTEMVRRNYILDTIKTVYQRYGYQQIETPAMENLSTLEGKYGDEGDKLLFKVLDSGEYLEGFKNEIKKNIKFRDILFDSLKELCKRLFFQYTDEQTRDITLISKYIRENINSLSFQFTDTFEFDIVKSFFLNYETTISYELYRFFSLAGISKDNFEKKFDFHFNQFRDTILNEFLYPLIIGKVSANYITNYISEKGLRYDFTVPFARYVVMHQNEITFPFKRYQIQPVWRADRPQKGRYREFVQCDADVIGSDSLLNEVEMIQMIDEVFSKLGIKVLIKINNRKILAGIAEEIGEADKIIDLTVVIDKINKIGLEKVNEELKSKGLSDAAINKLQPLITFSGGYERSINMLKSLIVSSNIGKQGILEIEQIANTILNLENNPLFYLSLTLARGLNYYTGAILEVEVDPRFSNFKGSLLGGGRYDDLTGIFGLPNVSGVGISFGVDRIYDLMEEMKLFDNLNLQTSTTQVMFVNFGKEEEKYCLKLLHQVRAAGINAEIYPDSAKMKKQMSYADAKKIPFVVLVGSEEMKTGALTLKNMETGDQEKISIDKLIEKTKMK